MNVGQAVATRFSARAFLPDPIPEETLRALILGAQRAPSGGNVQPWRVYGLTGDPLDILIADVRGRIAAGQHQRRPFPIYPDPLEDPYRARRRECGFSLYSALGVAREDFAARDAWHARNFELFGAPVALFFVLEAAAGPSQWADLGMFMQTLMLLAVEAGLGTCAQAAWAQWPETLARHLALPKGCVVASGMAIGRIDPDHPVNQWRTTRAPLDEIAHLSGF